MSSPLKPLPLPLKALAALETIPSAVFCNCLANIVTGGAAVLSSIEPKVLIATAAFAALFGWFGQRTRRDKKEQLARDIRAIKCDVHSAADWIEGIGKGRIEVNFTIDELMKSEIEDACRRAIAVKHDGLSQRDAETIIAAIHETATREQIEAFDTKFDDFSTEARVLLWTQDHRGRGQDVILRETQDSVAHMDVNMQRLADALERRENETDEHIAARLRPIIEAESDAKARSQFEQQLRDREETIDRLTKGVIRAANVPGLIEELRKTGDGRKIFEALRQVSTHTDADFIQVHRGIAEWAFLTGAIDDAKRSLDKILTVLPNDRDAINRKGHIHQLRGELADAEKCYQRLLKLSPNDSGWQAIANGNLGLIYKTRGDLDQAETMLKKALAIFEKLGRLEGVASNYGNLGLIYQTRGDLDQSEVMHKKALAIEEKLGRLEGIARHYGNLGLIYQMRGDLDQAEAMLKKSLAISEKLGLLEVMANQYANLGMLYKQRGKIAVAREYWTKSRDTFNKAQMPHMAVRVQELIDGLPNE